MTLSKLPIDDVLRRILDALGSDGHNTVILEAPPGAGKTTRVPWAILEMLAGRGTVIVTEPRRIAARLAATRVAGERGIKLGQEVGYSVRLEDKTSASTRLVYMTEGLLLRRLLDDELLSGASALVFDEVHEQGADLEVLLALAKRLQKKRPDLVLVMMSATLDAGELARHFPGAPVVRSEGRAFDVKIQYIEKPDDRPLPVQIRSAVRGALETPLGRSGDFLVFLPGAREIDQTSEALSGAFDLDVLRLHGEMPIEEQSKAIAPGLRQRVILATNVAESSLTIPGVRTVIDTGLARVQRHDPWSGIASLEVEEVSQARAIQRSGRAGRTAEGQAFRLYSRGNFERRPAHDTAELLRTNLTETLLFLLSSGLSPSELDFLHAPTPAQWEKAERELVLLGAAEKGEVTSLGRRMARLPLPARVARFVVEAEDLGIADDALVVAALLAERDILRTSRSFGGRKRDLETADSDLEDRVHRFHEITRARFSRATAESLEVDLGVVRRVSDSAKQLSRLVRTTSAPKKNASPEHLLKAALFSGFPDRIATRRPNSRTLVLASGIEATLSEQSVVPETPLLFAFSIDAPSGRARTPLVRLAMKITADEILELAGDAVEAREEYSWNAEKERVDVSSLLAYGKVVLDREVRRAPPDRRTAEILAKVLEQKGPSVFDPEGRLESLGVRFRLLEAHGKAETAAFDDEERKTLEKLANVENFGSEALVLACLESTSLAEVQKSDLAEILLRGLPPTIGSALERHLPSHVTLPGGLRVGVHYERDRTPWIEARLQNFFSVGETPSLFRGKLPLQIHLLAPNHRAVQVTTDLRGFWEKHYPTLRKELMRKYPKHLWPEDGANANPPTPGKIR